MMTRVLSIFKFLSLVSLLFIHTDVNSFKLEINNDTPQLKRTLTFGLGILLSLAPISASALIDSPSIERFEDARRTLVNLDSNWKQLVQGQGDNVRRKLGTVYTPPTCSSPLCGFPSFVQKFVRNHPDDLDVPSFEEPMNEFLEAINQADFLAYSSIFSEYGNGGGGEDYLKNSQLQVQRAIHAMDKVLQVVKD